jgi:hypothetical protein
MLDSRFDARRTGTGFAGFRLNKEYQLRYTREFDEVSIALDHAPTPNQVLTLTVEQFNKWFVK